MAWSNRPFGPKGGSAGRFWSDSDCRSGEYAALGAPGCVQRPPARNTRRPGGRLPPLSGNNRSFCPKSKADAWPQRRTVGSKPGRFRIQSNTRRPNLAPGSSRSRLDHAQARPPEPLPCGRFAAAWERDLLRAGVLPRHGPSRAGVAARQAPGCGLPGVRTGAHVPGCRMPQDSARHRL